MGYVRVEDPLGDPGKPGRSTDFKQIRDNQDWFDSLLDSLVARSSQDIMDDFARSSLAAAWDAELWVSLESGTRTKSHDADDHYIRYYVGGSSAGSFSLMSDARRMRIELSRDHHVICEWRMISTNDDATSNFRFAYGLQDTALAAPNVVWDDSDFIGFIVGSTQDTVKATTGKGGAIQVVADDQGDVTNWTKLKIDVQSSSGGTVFALKFYVDDVQVGSTHTDAANVPTTVELRPMMGVAEINGNSGGAEYVAHNCDYALAYWIARPLSP